MGRWASESHSGFLMYVDSRRLLHGTVKTMPDGRAFTLSLSGYNGREYIYRAEKVEDD
jgi:hypothetical protein